MAQQLQPSEKSIFQIVQAIIQGVNGRHNATVEATLTPNATTTTVSFVNCSAGSVPLPCPLTAHAAQEIGNGTMWVSNVTNGAFTVTHANNAQADRTFLWSLAGG